ncbi:8-oxo-dGTP diphosphatase [Neobacillus sp. YIM B06451]|uniref:NUDIX hydrolase n=1 Tax=Neobacillus sp. YIM B06451 TaxID=3070994 RepID=UPI00292F73B6|nr:8-oxo-dGTP diphosphatase [Neobacillus sp. YIM B06451]
MQRVANCVLMKDSEILLLQKPRRGWWSAPGGKMEQGESVRDACIREYREETGIYLKHPKLKGVFTIIIQENGQTVNEWMMFTFFAKEYEGKLSESCEEGILQWHSADRISGLPMAPGDYHILEYTIHGNDIIFGTFTYTREFELIGYRLDPG